MVQKVAFITGASRGLGRSMARHLLEVGIGVVGTFKPGEEDADALERTFGDAGKVRMLPLDLTDEGCFSALNSNLVQVLEQTYACRHLDYVVQNAGVGVVGEVAEMTVAQLDLLYRTDLRGPFLLNQMLLPLLRDGGRIVNVSSAATRFYLKGHGPYAAVKAGIEVLTLYMAKELGTRDIRVNVVAPGAIETDFMGGEVRDDTALNRMFKEATPLGRVGRADDIGSVVRGLLSDDMGWLNGQRIEVSGGQSL